MPLDQATQGPAIAAWLGKRIPGATALRISDWDSPKVGNSNETVFVTAEFECAGALQEARLVLRRQMEGMELSLDPDVTRECRVLQALEGYPQIRSPRVVGLETDRSVLGTPFYVMERIAGRPIQQYPNFHQAGWLAEAAPHERSAVWRNALQAVVAVHQIDWRRDFRFLDRPARGDEGLPQYLHHLEEWYRWAAAGREISTAESAMRWLKTTAPQGLPTSLLWGDPIPANMLFDERGAVTAVLDWEFPALGPAEIDLGWWLFMDSLFCEVSGVSRLEGLPDRQGTIALYEELIGRRVVNIEYFEVLSMMRMGLMAIRMSDRQVKCGHISPESTAYKNNPMMALIAAKLGLPPVTVGADYAEMAGKKSN